MPYVNKCLSCGNEWTSPTNAGKPEECPECKTTSSQMLRCSLWRDPDGVAAEEAAAEAPGPEATTSLDASAGSKFQPTDEASAKVERAPGPDLSVTSGPANED